MKNLVVLELHPGYLLRIKSTGLPEGGTAVKLSRLAAQRLGDALHAAAEQGSKAGTFITAGEEVSAATPKQRSSVVFLDGKAKRRGTVVRL